MVLDLCNSVSNEINSLSVFFGSDVALSQDMFIALRPIDLSSAQTCSPLLEIHTNDVVMTLFECSANACRKFFILSSSA